MRLRKFIVKRITVVKFRVDDRGSNGTLYRQLRNQDKVRYGKADQCDSNRLWREM